MQTVRKGDSGQTVRVLQRLLGATPDGDFGEKTKAAVVAFQGRSGLSADGIAGPKTWAALSDAQEKIKSGSAGSDVAAVQDILGITADGQFGQQTKAAVIRAQYAAGLPADGVVGPQTWKYLLTVYSLQPSSGAANPVRPVDYKQFDARWAKVMYSNHGDPAQTIKSGGCGPTAMADIVATWANPNITPVQTCADAAENGFRTYSSGTRREYFAWAAAKYGWTCEQTTSTDAAIAALQSGALVIALMGPGYWTKQGHYICLWKYDAATDHIYACDPGSSTRTNSSSDIFRAQRKAYFIIRK